MSLPVILSLPHGGLHVPPELHSRLEIDATRIYNECDLWVDQLFDFAHPDLGHLAAGADQTGVLERISCPVARVLVDANRRPDDLDDPDGAVKTTTSYGQPIYRDPPTRPEREELLQRYWQPFHAAMEQAIHKHATSVQIFLDCHNMAQIGPKAYAHAGRPRPLICLANLGDHQGEPRAATAELTCPPSLIRRAAALAQELFRDLDLLEPADTTPSVVAINHPFPGGYILQHYHARLRRLAGRNVPAIMIEVNRGLIVGNQSTTTPIAPMHTTAVATVRERLYQWTLALLDELTANGSEQNALEGDRG
jgi:N-formylglutamate deformylase